MKKITLFMTALIAMGQIALAEGTPAAATATTTTPAAMKGGMLVDAKGMTLYTFDKDTAGATKSACAGPCVEKWPAYKAPADATASGDFTTIAADGGAKQWAYKGKPLYYFAQDKKAGEKKGDNLNNVWHIVK